MRSILMAEKGGSHFPERVHRIVAFELVLFTCYQSVLTITIFLGLDLPAHPDHLTDYTPLPMPLWVYLPLGNRSTKFVLRHDLLDFQGIGGGGGIQRLVLPMVLCSK